jgi:Lrp/AsnC family transcriptional regulator for asnA, asnC and gidA
MNIYQLDQLDKAILRRLLENARSSFSNIAKEHNVSVYAITKRFNKLKRNGIISGTIILLDLTQNQQEFSLAITVDLFSQKKEKDVIEKIKEIKNVVFCTPVIGNHHLFVYASVINFEQIEKIRKNIKKIENVKRIAITSNLDKYYTFFINLLD